MDHINLPQFAVVSEVLFGEIRSSTDGIRYGPLTAVDLQTTGQRGVPVSAVGAFREDGPIRDIDTATQAMADDRSGHARMSNRN